MKFLPKVFVISMSLVIALSSSVVFAKEKNISDNAPDPSEVISTFVPSISSDAGEFNAMTSNVVTLASSPYQWSHSGWVNFQDPQNAGRKQAECETSCYLIYGNTPVSHYSRAQLTVWLSGAVRLDSGRQYGTGNSSAESGWGVPELVAKTYYGM